MPLAVSAATISVFLAAVPVAFGGPASPNGIISAGDEGDGTRGKRDAASPGSVANSPATSASVKRAVQGLGAQNADPVVPPGRMPPNSRVGLIAAYIDAVEASAKADSRIAALDQQIRTLEAASPGDPKLKALKTERATVAAARDTLMRAQRDALDATANKPMSQELLSAVNAILGLESSTRLTSEGKTGAEATSSAHAEPGPGLESAPVEPAR
jgi:hypothetical protein